MKKEIQLQQNSVWEQKRFLFLISLLFFSIPFIVHLDLLTTGQSLVSSDGVGLIYESAYLKDSLLNMEFPLWIPYLEGGMPYAEIWSSVLNPIHWIIALCPGILQLCVFFGIYYAIGGTFMFLYLKKIGCAPAVSLVVSVMYLFTVHMGGLRKEHAGLIATALLLPAILFFMEKYIRENRLKWLLCSSAAMALQYFGGFLQYVVYSDIFVFFYLLCSGLHERIPLKKIISHGITWITAYFGMLCASILPLARLLLMQATEGSSPMPLEQFKTLSLHPINLLMAVFPNIFGEPVWQPLLSTSGMDTELVIGAAALTIALAGITLARKNFYASFMTAAAFMAFLYACLGSYDWLAKFFYQIPVLKAFRLPCRTLFICTFSAMALIALGLQGICTEQISLKKMTVIHGCVAMGMLAVFLLYRSPSFSELIGKELEKDVVKVFTVPTLLFGIYLVFYYGFQFVRQKGNTAWGIARRTFVLSVAAVMIMTTWPYYKFSWSTGYNQLIAFPEHIRQEVGTDKILCTDLASRILDSNGTMLLRIPSLNSYTNFNLGALYKYLTHKDTAPMNSSGLYMYFPYAQHMLSDENKLLSMFGARYLVMKEPPERMQIIVGFSPRKNLLHVSSIELTDAEGLQFAAWPVQLESDSYYRISLTVSAPQGGNDFFVDFAAIGYDSGNQEKWFKSRQGIHTYEAILPSETCEKIENILFRIISLTDEDLDILDVKVEKGVPVFETPYQLFAEEPEFQVYENRNARELVYAPDRVLTIPEEERDDLYLYTDDYDILNTSYVVGKARELDLTNPDVQISNIVLKNNSVSAQVTASDTAFVNMSQNYYPGWNVYIDGKKGQVYEVNGIIQGTFVPAGSHTVVFRYQPMIFYLGLALSVTAAVCCIVVASCTEKREYGKKKEEGEIG